MAANDVSERAAVALAKAKAAIVKRFPFTGRIIKSLRAVEAPGIGTMGVTARGTLYYDPAAIASWSHSGNQFAVMHEYSHCYRRHGVRCPKHYNHDKANKAMDMAINPPILALGLTPPFPGICMPRDIGQPDGLAWEEYYAAMPDEEGDSSPSNGAPGTGKCGSCAAGNDDAHYDEDREGVPPAMSAADMAAAVRECARETVEYAKRNPGKVPGGWLVAAEEVLAKAQVSWQQELSHTTRTACAFTRGHVTRTYRTPNRRQWGLGRPGSTSILPGSHRPVPHVLLLLDTSGSMMGDATWRALCEAEGLLRSVRGTLTVMVCDTQVHGVKQVRTLRDVRDMLRGGGGSDFRPAFDAISAMAKRPDVVVCATDTDIYVPKEAPSGYSVVWLAIGDYATHRPIAEDGTRVTWGKHIKVGINKNNRGGRS